MVNLFANFEWNNNFLYNICYIENSYKGDWCKKCASNCAAWVRCLNGL